MTRPLSLVRRVPLGVSNEAINLYLPIRALRAVFIHSNLRFEMPPRQRIIAMPRFNHWHHTRDPNLVNRNFSVSLPLWDLLFGQSCRIQCARGPPPTPKCKVRRTV